MKHIKSLITATLLAGTAFAADGPITGFSTIATMAGGDKFYAVDVSDTSQSINGTSKQVLASTVGALYINDTAYSSAFNAITDSAASKNSIYDYLHIGDADDDGKIDVLDLAAAGFPALNSSGALVASRSVAEGTGIDVTNGDGTSGNPTVAFDSTEIGTTSWSNGASASFVWTNDLSGTDTVWTMSSGVVNLSTGTLQQGGVDVVTLTGSQSLTNKTLDSPIVTTKFNYPNGSADATLSIAGDTHFNTTDEQISFHTANDGEVTGEVSISVIRTFSITFDPKAICDGTIDRLFLFNVGDDAPEGIVIDEWKISFSQDPTTEVDLDLKRADAPIGVASAAVMDVLDTTSGVASEDTDTNINGGNTIANGQWIYVEFGTAYTAANEQIVLQIWYHNEED